MQWCLASVVASAAEKREFIRQVYSEATASTEAARQTYISEWRADALEVMRSGGVLTSASANGHGTGRVVAPGWTTSDIMELADWARSYVSESTVDLALASVPARVKSFQTYTTNVRVY